MVLILTEAIVMLSEIVWYEFSWFPNAFNTGVGYFRNNYWYTWLQIYNDVLISKVIREISLRLTVVLNPF